MELPRTSMDMGVSRKLMYSKIGENHRETWRKIFEELKANLKQSGVMEEKAREDHITEEKR